MEDLLRDEVVTRAAIRRPDDETIERLLKDSVKTIKKHRLYPDAAKHKQTVNTKNSEWAEMAEISLFRSKRSKQLAMILTIRKLFQKVMLSEDIRADEWRELFNSSAFKQAVRQIVRVVKAERASA